MNSSSIVSALTVLTLLVASAANAQFGRNPKDSVSTRLQTEALTRYLDSVKTKEYRLAGRSNRTAGRENSPALSRSTQLPAAPRSSVIRTVERMTVTQAPKNSQRAEKGGLTDR